MPITGTETSSCVWDIEPMLSRTTFLTTTSALPMILSCLGVEKSWSCITAIPTTGVLLSQTLESVRTSANASGQWQNTSREQRSFWLTIVMASRTYHFRYSSNTFENMEKLRLFSVSDRTLVITWSPYRKGTVAWCRQFRLSIMVIYGLMEVSSSSRRIFSIIYTRKKSL